MNIEPKLQYADNAWEIAWRRYFTLYTSSWKMENRDRCAGQGNEIRRGTDAVTTEYLNKHHRTTLTRHQVEKNPQQILICNTKSVLYVQRRYRRIWLPRIIDITDRQMASG